MRFIAWHMFIAGWLLFSAFLMPHSPGSTALTALLAVFIGTVGLAAPGLRGVRFVNTGLALILAVTAFVMPDVGWLARLNNLAVALAVFALSVVPGRSWGASLLRDEPKS